MSLLKKPARLKCRCGQPAVDPLTTWMVMLRDPTGARSVIVPTCSSCALVLFDLLAKDGWLTQPTMGETIDIARAELEKKKIADANPETVDAWVQEWEESERGWGVRPDGYTVHWRRQDVKAFLDQMRARERKENGSGVTPDIYSRPRGEPMPLKVHRSLMPKLGAMGVWLPSDFNPKKQERWDLPATHSVNT